MKRGVQTRDQPFTLDLLAKSVAVAEYFEYLICGQDRATFLICLHGVPVGRQDILPGPIDLLGFRGVGGEVRHRASRDP